MYVLPFVLFIAWYLDQDQGMMTLLKLSMKALLLPLRYWLRMLDSLLFWSRWPRAMKYKWVCKPKWLPCFKYRARCRLKFRPHRYYQSSNLIMLGRKWWYSLKRRILKSFSSSSGSEELEFYGTEDVMQGDEWLEHINDVFNTIVCTHKQRVLLTSTMLRGLA